MVTFEMPMLLAAAETGSQSVSITRGGWYHYADYGLGSYITAPYYVSWGGIKATAYCVQPSKNGPDDGTYSITKLSDGKTLAKVCYYGTKASDENGFFDEKHPDFSAGKRFIITHLAAAYANGSSDWDSGTNATGRSLAMELYNYCINMPDIPDVDMSFSDSDVKAYVEGNIQRTKTITFKADELQTITFKLPQGVKLVNVTTGKTSAAGASVEICGGTQFYLTAPLSQAENVSASFSSKMKGSIDKEYSAYKITTGSSTQDLALVFGEGVGNEKYVDFKVTWTKECYISIVKKDSETSNTLAGAVYGIYSDAACTQLIKQIPATDANGASKVTIEKTQEVVYLKEISVPTGYTIDAKAYNVTLNIGKTSNMNVTDKRVTATISLHKQDAETGNIPQGDATLEGAVYGLFAREDIVHPDGKTGVLYKKGTQITSLTTDKNGQASVSNLYLGKYYFKELTPPVGYLLDQEEHEVDCSYEGANVPVVERKAISKEDVIKQPFQIIKAANNGKTDADLLKGVGFSVWLVSDLKVKSDGSYDFFSANPVVITADGKTEMFTDEKGYACSIPLPYGTYVVKETTSKHNYEPVDDFIVTINENHPDTPQVWRVLLDKEFEAKLKIIKKDDETKKSVLLANTEFKVYDLDHQKYVEQVTTYPSTKVHKSYFTDDNGYLILPNNLEIGNYRIEEVTAPEGYTQSSAYVNVSVDTNTAYMIDPTSKDAIIEVEYENHPVKGELKIFKQGELLTGYDKDFQYELCGLKGVTFEVYAAEDIFTADHQVDENGNRTLYYAKDALVAEVTTDDEGFAYVKNLPLGEYYVKESEATEGFVHNENSEKAVFVYADQNTPVVFDQVSFTNERQKVSISVEKQDADNGNVVPGAVFGIYNTEDIINKDGQVIVKADTLLQEMTSDEDGQAKCTLDLPLGQYYVKELHAPAGFVSSDEILSFDASYQGQEIQTVELKAVKKNEPTVVEITKSDITTGEELDGAYLQVLDQDGNIIDSYLIVFYVVEKCAWLYRHCIGGTVVQKLGVMLMNIPVAFQSWIPSFHIRDLFAGVIGALLLRCAVYMKGKNAKKFRQGEEYGSARWGNEKDIEPFIDPVFENNIILTQTERLTMNSRPKLPKYARNKNVIVIGGSGSGKTRFYVKPNLMQMPDKVSYVVTDPKGTIIVECGTMLVRHGYRIKVLNTINFKKSMHYNPFHYIRSEKDILKLVNTIIANTKGEGEKAAEDFWIKAERLLYTALIGYIWYEAPEEEQNFSTLLEFINASETREEDEEFKNAVDELFEELEAENPEHFAVRQYRKYKLAAGVISLKRLLNHHFLRNWSSKMIKKSLEAYFLPKYKIVLF